MGAAFIVLGIILSIGAVLYLANDSYNNTYGDACVKLKRVTQDTDYIVLRLENIIEHHRIEATLKSWPWPRIVQKDVIVKIFEAEELLAMCIQPIEEELITDVEKRCIESLDAYLTQEGKTNFAYTISELLHIVQKNMRGVIDERISNPEMRDVFGNAKELLATTIDLTLTRFKKEALLGIQERIEDTFKDFRTSVLSGLREQFIDFQGARKDGALDCLLPPQTRFFFKKEGSVILVLEFPPERRTIKFEKNFVTQEIGMNEELRRRHETDDKRMEFQLSFPYTVFVVHCIGEATPQLYCFYRNSPLKNLSDELYFPNIPNCFDSGKICIRIEEAKSTIFADQILEAIGQFWNSKFSNDLRNNHYDAMSLLEPRLKNIWTWENASAQNPRFPLEVQWRKCAQTLEQLVQGLTKNSGEDEVAKLDNAMRENIKKHAYGVGKIVEEHLHSMQTEGRYPKLTIDTLKKHLSDLAGIICTATLESCTENQKTTSGTNAARLAELLNQRLAADITKCFDTITELDAKRNASLNIKTIVGQMDKRENEVRA